MVDATKRLYGFQHGDGGWGWWQSDDTNRWMTAYVVYGLSLGKAAGLQVNPTVVARWPRVPHEPPRRGAPRPGRAHLDGLRPGLHRRRSQGRARQGLRAEPALQAQPGLLLLALLASKDKRARIAVENLDDILQAAKERQDARGEANDVWQTSEAIEATAYTLMASTGTIPTARG